MKIYKGFSRKALARVTVASIETEGDDIENVKVQAKLLAILDLLWKGRRHRMALIQ